MNRLALLFSLVLFICSAQAQDDSLRGHAKYQGGYLLRDGDDDDARHEMDLRLNAEHNKEGFEAVMHGQLLGLSTDLAVPSFYGALSLPTDDEALVDLSHEVYSEGDTRSIVRLDRLSLGYHVEDFRLLVGRQVVTLGNGLVFQVLDRLNPFPPLSIDKEYKRGSDMLFAGYAVNQDAELQIFAVPRRGLDADDGRRRVEQDQSSFAVRFRGHEQTSALDYEIMLAEHYDEEVYGVGVARDFLGAVVRADYALTDVEGDGVESSFLINIDRSAEFISRNVYWFLEYFHSGFGVSKGEYTALSVATVSRLQRGELYTIGEDYLSPGFRIELNPRTNFYGSCLWNLGDESGAVQSRLAYDLVQNGLVIVGVNQPFGGEGSEFGGLRINALDNASKATELYLRFEFYF